MKRKSPYTYDSVLHTKPATVRPRNSTKPPPRTRETLNNSNWLPETGRAEETLSRQRLAMGSIRSDRIAKGLIPLGENCPNEQLVVVPQLHAALKLSEAPWLKIYHEVLAICPSVEAGIVLCQILYWLDLTKKDKDGELVTRTKDPCILKASKAHVVDWCPWLTCRKVPKEDESPALKKRERSAIERSIGRIYAQLRQAGYISTRITGRGRGRQIEIMVHSDAIAEGITSFRNLLLVRLGAQRAASAAWKQLKDVREAEKRQRSHSRRLAQLHRARRKQELEG